MAETIPRRTPLLFPLALELQDCEPLYVRPLDNILPVPYRGRTTLHDIVACSGEQLSPSYALPLANASKPRVVRLIIRQHANHESGREEEQDSADAQHYIVFVQPT